MNPLPTKFSARRADRSTRIALRSIRATIAFDQLRPLQIQLTGELQGGAMANIVGHYLSFEGRLARLPFFGRGVYVFHRWVPKGRLVAAQLLSESRQLWTTYYEHPVVEPHVSHFMQVPFLTKVKFPHSPHASPS